MSHDKWGFAAACLSLAAVGPLQSQDQEANASQPQIRIVGTASRAVKPDFATITFGFVGEGASPREAGQRVALLADSLRRAFQSLGIPRDSIAAPDQWTWGRNRMEKTYANRIVTVPNGPPGATWQKQDTVYRGHDALRLSVHDLSKVGPAIDSAYAHGVVEVSELTFRATNTTAARDDVLRAAAKDARAQAVAIAEATGAKLGRLLALSTQPDARLDPYAQAIAIRDASVSTGSSSGTQVTAPVIPLAATIYARWELIPGP
jgi:hypothetical protein